MEGAKVQLHKLKAECKNNTSGKNTPPIVLSGKERAIMDIVKDIVNKNTYAIIEKDIKIKGYSRRLIDRTIRNKDILDLYGFKRVRANKEIKQELGITDKGYPFLIVKK